MADTERRPRILLSNDDGVRAPGLAAAYAALSEVGDVTVVAPSEQKSGASHTITLETPLRAHRLSTYPGYRVDFTPVDSVKLALKHLLPERPDLVVSGINQGPNGGFLVHYSGTVAAAKEAVLEGIPAMAISLCALREFDYAAAAQVCEVLARRLLAHPLPRGTVLNVNVPPGPWDALKGFRWCRQSLRPLDDTYERREDPRHRPYYWLTGAGPLEGAEPDDDLCSVSDGYVALTPLKVDWTHDEVFARGPGPLLAGLDGGMAGAEERGHLPPRPAKFFWGERVEVF